jgi:hypothetical protein
MPLPTVPGRPGKFPAGAKCSWTYCKHCGSQCTRKATSVDPHFQMPWCEQHFNELIASLERAIANGVMEAEEIDFNDPAMFMGRCSGWGVKCPHPGTQPVPYKNDDGSFTQYLFCEICYRNYLDDLNQKLADEFEAAD